MPGSAAGQDVPVVVSSNPVWQSGEGWRVTPEPLLTLGVVDTPLPQQFHRVDGVTRLSDGTIVVLDSSSGQLRAFDSSGRHLWSAGSLGQGPGEIRGDGRKSLIRLQGDTLLIKSGRNRIRRGPHGMLVDHEVENISGLGGYDRCSGLTTPPPDDTAPRLARCLRTRRLRIPGPWISETTVIRVASDPIRIDTIATFFIEDGWTTEDPRLTIRSPLGPKGKIRFSDDRRTLLYARNDAYRIDFWNLTTGTLSMVVERLTPRRVRTEVEVVMAVRWGFNPEPVRAVLRADDERLSVVDSLSIAEDFFLDALGFLWVRRSPSPLHGDEGIPQEIFTPDGAEKIGVERLPSGLHDVFRPDGIYLGTVKLPHDLWNIEVGPDYVLGVAFDEIGIELVRMFGLDRSSRGSG